MNSRTRHPAAPAAAFAAAALTLALAVGPAALGHADELPEPVVAEEAVAEELVLDEIVAEQPPVAEFTADDPPARLTGTVTDRHGTPLSGVLVSLIDDDTDLVVDEYFTDADGRYELASEPQDYHLYAEPGVLSGFRPQWWSNQTDSMWANVIDLPFGDTVRDVTLWEGLEAVDDFYSTHAGTPLVVDAAIGFLANDEGWSTLTFDGTCDPAPAHGDLDIAGDGSFTYTPDAGFAGVDHFGYRVADALDDSDCALVRILVVAEDPLVLADDEYTVITGEVLDLGDSSVLENDEYTSSQSAVQTSDVLHGELVFDDKGTFVYVPAPGFVGVDSFTYSAFDANTGRASVVDATVRITVMAIDEDVDDDETVTTTPDDDLETLAVTGAADPAPLALAIAALLGLGGALALVGRRRLA